MSQSSSVPSVSMSKSAKITMPFTGSKQYEPPNEPSVAEEHHDRPFTGMYHLRRIQITSLGEDDALGLLLQGTTVNGFYKAEATTLGFRIGDEIVEVNGNRVNTFNDFLHFFKLAKVEGLPFNFAVVRQEEDCDDTALMQDLQCFFDSANFNHWVSEVLHRPPPRDDIEGLALTTPFEWSEEAKEAQNQKGYRIQVPRDEVENSYSLESLDNEDVRYLEIPQSSKQHFQQVAQSITNEVANTVVMENILSNPFVQALHKRRLDHTPDWTSDEPLLSLPVRLATRHDGLPTLAVEPLEVEKNCFSKAAEGIACHSPRGCHSACASHAPAAWRCCGGNNHCRQGPVSEKEGELFPTPRAMSMATFEGIEAQPVLSDFRPVTPDLDEELLAGVSRGHFEAWTKTGDSQSSLFPSPPSGDSQRERAASSSHDTFHPEPKNVAVQFLDPSPSRRAPEEPKRNFLVA